MSGSRWARGVWLEAGLVSKGEGGGGEEVEGRGGWRLAAAFNGANSILANYISIPLRDRCSKHARQRPTEFLAD